MIKKSSRHKQILQSLAHMLEINPGERITTARLAEEVGVSEAALYRHFPSKSKMFEGLIEFIEDTLFTRTKTIIAEEQTATARCKKILELLLTFAERNPGISRILTGDALAGETERLRSRVVQLFDRLETTIKQVLRDAEFHEKQRTTIPLVSAANLLMCSAEGRIMQFVRSEFRKRPTENWAQQWELLSSNLLMPTAALANTQQAQSL